MTTQLEYAKRRKITEEVKKIASDEGLTPEYVMRGVAQGRIVVTKNLRREITPLGIGEGLSRM